MFGATFKVDKITDSWTGTTYNMVVGELRWAIRMANANNNPSVMDTIKFNFPNFSAPVTITLLLKDQVITEKLIMDGNSQNVGSYTGNEPRIKIVAAGLWPSTGGKMFFVGYGAAQCQFKNIQFSGSPQDSMAILWFDSSSDNLVENCVFYQNMQECVILSGDSDRNIFKRNYFGTDKNFSIDPNTILINGVSINDGTSNGVPDNNIFGGGSVSDINYFYNTNIDVSSAGINISSGSKNKILNNVFA